MILINNSPHENGVYTFIDREAELIVKSSFTIEGIDRLKREFSGYEWYFKMTNHSDKEMLGISPNSSNYYTKIYINCFPGKVGDSNRFINDNKLLLRKGIDHYVSTWPANRSNPAPLHGDFSIGNLIFNEESVTIIDWEHFALNAAPWGFDLVNMLYESLFISLDGTDMLHHNDKIAFFEVRDYIISVLDEKQSFKCKLDDLTSFMESNVFLWGSLIKKFPVLKFSLRQKELINQLELQQDI